MELPANVSKLKVSRYLDMPTTVSGRLRYHTAPNRQISPDVDNSDVYFCKSPQCKRARLVADQKEAVYVCESCGVVAGRIYTTDILANSTDSDAIQDYQYQNDGATTAAFQSTDASHSRPNRGHDDNLSTLIVPKSKLGSKDSEMMQFQRDYFRNLKNGNNPNNPNANNPRKPKSTTLQMSHRVMQKESRDRVEESSNRIIRAIKRAVRVMGHAEDIDTSPRISNNSNNNSDVDTKKQEAMWKPADWVFRAYKLMRAFLRSRFDQRHIAKARNQLIGKKKKNKETKATTATATSGEYDAKASQARALLAKLVASDPNVDPIIDHKRFATNDLTITIARGLVDPPRVFCREYTVTAVLCCHRALGEYLGEIAPRRWLAKACNRQRGTLLAQEKEIVNLLQLKPFTRFNRLTGQCVHYMHLFPDLREYAPTNADAALVLRHIYTAPFAIQETARQMQTSTMTISEATDKFGLLILRLRERERKKRTASSGEGEEADPDLNDNVIHDNIQHHDRVVAGVIAHMVLRMRLSQHKIRLREQARAKKGEENQDQEEDDDEDDEGETDNMDTSSVTTTPHSNRNLANRMGIRQEAFCKRVDIMPRTFHACKIHLQYYFSVIAIS